MRPAAAGFTLIEVLLGLAMLCILMGASSSLIIAGKVRDRQARDRYEAHQLALSTLDRIRARSDANLTLFIGTLPRETRLSAPLEATITVSSRYLPIEGTDLLKVAVRYRTGPARWSSYALEGIR